MYEEGFYWVKIAHFLNWHVGYFNGKYWKLPDDENEYSHLDFNIINPNKLLPPK